MLRLTLIPSLDKCGFVSCRVLDVLRCVYQICGQILWSDGDRTTATDCLVSHKEGHSSSLLVEVDYEPL